MNGIGFKNMKVFKEHQWFDFKPITLLTGTNNSGKSSVINAMQMLQENLSAKTLDELLETEFVLKANQNKHGSIDSFVNKQSNDNTLHFERIINEFKYIIHIKILDGLQKKGVVSAVEIFCNSTNERIFKIQVDKQYPDFKCSFNLNYSFFLDRFNKKCKNTLLYYKKIEKLQSKINKLNEGKSHLKNEILEEIKKIEQEFNLDINFSDKSEILRINDEGEVEELSEKEKEKYSIFGIFFNETDEFLHLSDFDAIKQSVFTYKDEQIDKKNEFGFVFRKSSNGVLHRDLFNEMFLIPYNKGIMNIIQILDEEEDKFISINFKSKVSNFYNETFEKAYKLFCDDWISLCSKFIWQPEFESEDEEIDPSTNLADKYINSLTDFGTITSILRYQKKKSLKCTVRA
jgi:energy-coupling factor transporter ATP-binding protein EcfA2